MLQSTSRTRASKYRSRPTLSFPWNDAAVVTRKRAGSSLRLRHRICIKCGTPSACMDPSTIRASENESKEYAIVQLEMRVHAEEEVTESWLDG